MGHFFFLEENPPSQTPWQVFFSIHQHFEWDYSLFSGEHPAHSRMLKSIPPPTLQMPVATSPPTPPSTTFGANQECLQMSAVSPRG